MILVYVAIMRIHGNPDRGMYYVVDTHGVEGRDRYELWRVVSVADIYWMGDDDGDPWVRVPFSTDIAGAFVRPSEAIKFARYADARSCYVED